MVADGNHIEPSIIETTYSWILLAGKGTSILLEEGWGLCFLGDFFSLSKFDGEGGFLSRIRAGKNILKALYALTKNEKKIFGLRKKPKPKCVFLKLLTLSQKSLKLTKICAQTPIVN